MPSPEVIPEVLIDVLEKWRSGDYELTPLKSEADISEAIQNNKVFVIPGTTHESAVIQFLGWSMFLILIFFH